MKKRRAPEGVTRRYTFKLYPNLAQREVLEGQRRLHCALYNAALQERIDAYRLAGKTLMHHEQAKSIKIIRADDPAYAALSADSLSQTLLRLDRAYRAFFRRARSGAGDQSGFPHYKKSADYPGFTFRHGNGWRFDLMPNARSGLTYIKGVPGPIRWRGRFPAFPYTVNTCDAMLVAGEWLLSVVVDIQPRMRADARLTGEVTFDLVDSFAHVRCVNGGPAAGPEETTYLAANGRIYPFSEAIHGNFRLESETSGIVPVETSQMRGDQGQWRAVGRKPAPVETSQMRGDQGRGGREVHRQAPVETSQMRGDQGRVLLTAETGSPVETSQMRGDQGRTPRCYRGPPPVETSQMRGDQGVPLVYEPDDMPVETSQMRGDQGRLSSSEKSPVETSQMRGDQGEPLGRSPIGSPTETSQIRGDQGGKGKSRKRGSCKDRSHKRRQARTDARAARQRRESLHVWTTRLARLFHNLSIKSPPLVETTRSGHGDKYAWGAMTALKASLNRRVLDQSPGSAIAMLTYKVAERHGETVVVRIEDAPAAAGNLIVEARKTNRKLKRTTNAQRPERLHPHRPASA